MATDTEGNLRTLDEAEPRAAVDRLAWHVNRAVGWIKGASEGTLLAPGAHFELPFYPGRPTLAIAFREGPGDLGAWDDVEAGVGTADLVRLDTAGGPWRAATAFRSLDGAVVARPSWGDAIPAARAERASALWIAVRRPRAVRRPADMGRAPRGARAASSTRSCASSLPAGGIAGAGPSCSGSPCRRSSAVRRCRSTGWPSTCRPSRRAGGSKRAHEREAASWAAATRTILAARAPIPWAVSENWHPDELEPAAGWPRTSPAPGSS